MLVEFQQRSLRGWEWFQARAHGKYAQAWLSSLSFSESSFLFIAPDFLLVAMLLAGAERWIYYAALTTVASVLGALFGYLLGAVFYDTVGMRLIDFYGIAQEIDTIGRLFDKNTFWAIFAAAFTPLPYKVFVLAGGFFKVDIVYFLIGSVLGRGLRYFLLAYIVRRFGGYFARLILKYFAASALIFILAFVAYIIFLLV